MGRPRRLLSSLVRVAVVALAVGVVAWALLPGGPLDPAGGPEGADGLGSGGPVTEDGGGTDVDVATPSPGAFGPSPWEEEELVVAVRNRADPSRNVTAAVADALDYWNENGGYADYRARFRLRPDAADPDVVVWYNETIECPAHHDAVGCAPMLDGSRTVDPPVAVQVRHDPADNRRQVGNTVIHELGHVLGISHCDEPYWVMASSCSEPVPPAPDATERDLAWHGDTVTVHVDVSNVSATERDETRDQVGHALSYFEGADPEEFPGNVTLVRVDDRFDADVSVVFLGEPACGDDAVVCYSRRGRDFDGDGRMEYYTAGTIHVVPDVDVEARGWYVGYALAHQLSPGNVPETFDGETSYRERRSRWWE